MKWLTRTSRYFRQVANGMESEDFRWKVPIRFFLILLTSSFIFLAFNAFQVSYYSITAQYLIEDESFANNTDLDGFLVKTSGCRIPNMDPLQPAVKPFIFAPKEPKCNSRRPALVDSNSTSIFFQNNASIPKYLRKPTSDPTLHCCYRALHRKSDSDSMEHEARCEPFVASANISKEFIQVLCTSAGGGTVYQDFFSFVPIKASTPIKPKSPLSVLVIGTDAVSRLNLHRQMPKTVGLLRELSAIEFLGYNKVGDNTFPNLIPVLTGLSEAELQKSCWPRPDDVFDNCSFVWQAYREAGYLTAFGEDSAWMGLFTYMRSGFRRQPTDYMYGPFNRLAENQIGNSHNMNVNECVGARQVYKVFLKYVYEFAKTMHAARLPYFGFFWGSSLSHDYLNKPRLGDAFYARLLGALNASEHLERTIVVFMSDHGIRWGEFRETYQGQIEERLPFLYFILPKWYRSQYSAHVQNMIGNTRRLTTPFDLHETLKNLLNPFEIAKASANARGYSLFGKIPENRTCADAAIAEHWCTCQSSLEIESSNVDVVESASFAVFTINQKLIGYRSCANLTIKDVISARLMQTNNKIKETVENVKDFMITFKTQPGDAVFEATVRRNRVIKNDTYHLAVMGTISRLNLYSKQSDCITDYHLKLYCYCTGFF